MLPKMQASHFVKKYSVQFVNSAGRESAPFYFWDNKPHECSQTWQVVRSEFDQMMLDNAREHGVDAREGVRVHDVLFEGDRAVGVTIKDEDGTLRDVRAKVVVDASGQNGLLMNRLGLRVWDPDPEQGRDLDLLEGRLPRHGPRRGRDAGHPDRQQEGLVLVHPAARRHRQRRRRGAVRLPVQGAHELRADLRGRSRELPGREGARRRTPRASPATSRRRTTRTARSRWPATAGCWSATRSASSTRLFVGRAAGAASPASWRPTRSSKGLPAATRRPRSWAGGAPGSTRAWTACAAWSASTTTASASARWSGSSPRCGARSPTCSSAISSTTAWTRSGRRSSRCTRQARSRSRRGTPARPASDATGKANELVLPDGARP